MSFITPRTFLCSSDQVSHYIEKEASVSIPLISSEMLCLRSWNVSGLLPYSFFQVSAKENVKRRKIRWPGRPPSSPNLEISLCGNCINSHRGLPVCYIFSVHPFSLEIIVHIFNYLSWWGKSNIEMCFEIHLCCFYLFVSFDLLSGNLYGRCYSPAAHREVRQYFSFY